MTHRFYVPAASGEAVVFSPEQSRQIARVLRMRPGDEVEVFDGRGAALAVELVSVASARAEALVRDAKTLAWPWPWRPLLYLSLIRPQRFEWAVEKATELGAWAIGPLLAERCTHGGGETSASRLTRWRQLAVEAAEQCGSAFVPEIRPACTLPEAPDEAAVLRLFAWERKDAPNRRWVAEVVQGFHKSSAAPAPTVACFVGPEGGFTDREVEAAADVGCAFVSLGPQTLRSETAALALLAQLGARGAD